MMCENQTTVHGLLRHILGTVCRATFYFINVPTSKKVPTGRYASKQTILCNRPLERFYTTLYSSVSIKYCLVLMVVSKMIYPLNVPSILFALYLFLADVLPPSFELRVRLLRKTGERVRERERESSPDKSTVADKGNALNLFAFAVSSSPSSPSHSSLSLRSDNKEGEITVACQIQYRAPFE